ncbi:cell division protein FtsQ/DivIB [uncultured Tolumonas sp.]|uniref:cell division protein FtsQ/DivIB n=1 Tax=uncultured Tolumonas sp. TaxID=263765 RepID=UPI002A0A2ABD|nr:cell division protein FtsQ/DivIB [uncultured Tolumonas sp.]
MRQARLASDEQDPAPVESRRQIAETTTRTRGEFIFGFVFFVSVVAGLWSTATDIRRWLFDEDKIPVSGLVVQGDLEYVSTEEVRKVLAENPQTNNFFTLDVNQLQKEVEALPWVYQSSIRKRWPALLYVYVVEQTPCALWGNDRLLSIRGTIFQAPRDRLKKPLVQLSGPDEMAGKVWEQYQQFERLLALNGYHVASVHMTNRHSWEIQLASGPKLILGRNDMLVKLQQFIDVYPKLENRELIDYLDLRYDTGIAVRWKQQEGSGDDQNPRQKSNSRA